MKKPFLPLFFLVFCLTLIAFKCEDDKPSITQEEERAELDIIKSDIQTLANTSVCNDTAECQFIGLGSKPCGGPWSYLIYSTSIDVQKLENLVENYNQKEADFNTKWGIPSDCALTTPPISIKCENNSCIPVY